jgi:hypothetical protein
MIELENQGKNVMSKTDSKDIEKYLKNKKHISWTLFPLVCDYTVETTLAVYCLNPPSLSYRVSENIREILTTRGYTRLYVLYLFSRIGEFAEICGKPIEELIDKKCNELIGEIIPDVGKIFFAYGEPANKTILKLITQRSAEVQKRILNIKSNTDFFHFGKLSEQGFPKILDELKAEDIENQF